MATDGTDGNADRESLTAKQVYKLTPKACIECDCPGCTHRNPKRCACRHAHYCSTECQIKDRKHHIGLCKAKCAMLEPSDSQDESSKDTSAAAEVDRGIELMEEDGELECLICHDTAASPIALDCCKKSYCFKCIRDWQKTSMLMGEPVADLSCPCCRAKVVNVEDAVMHNADDLSTTFSETSSEEEKEKVKQRALALINVVLATPNSKIWAFYIKALILWRCHERRDALQVLDDMLKEDDARKRQPVHDIMKRAVLSRDLALCDEVVERYGFPPDVMDATNLMVLDELRALIYTSLEEWDLTLSLFEKLIARGNKADPHMLTWYGGMAKASHELGEHDKTIEACDAIISMDRHCDSKFYEWKALSHQALDEMDAAITTMNRAVLYATPLDEEKVVESWKFYQELCSE